MLTSKELLEKMSMLRGPNGAGENRSTEPSVFKKLNFSAGDSRTLILLGQRGQDPFEYKFVHTFLHNYKVPDTCPSTFGDECPICNLTKSRSFWDAYRTFIKGQVRGFYKNFVVKYVLRIYLYDQTTKTGYMTYFYDDDAQAFLQFLVDIGGTANRYITITRDTNYNFSFTLPQNVASLPEDDKQNILTVYMPHVKFGPMESPDRVVGPDDLINYAKLYVASASAPFYSAVFDEAPPQQVAPSIAAPQFNGGFQQPQQPVQQPVQPQPAQQMPIQGQPLPSATTQQSAAPAPDNVVAGTSVNIKEMVNGDVNNTDSLF